MIVMKNNNILRVILTCFAVILFACMAMGSNIAIGGIELGDPNMTEEEIKEYYTLINSRIESCTGTCLTREEMAQHIYDFEKIQKGNDLDLKLETPGEHEHDEKTRYQITTLGTNKDGVYQGIKVEVMDDTSACKIEETEPQQPSETVQAAALLPVEEIVGTYEAKANVTVNMKGKDEDEDWTEIDSQEVSFKYTVTAIDSNKIRVDMESVKYGEGVYDPATGVCDVKVAPDFYAAFKTEPKDETTRFTFSKKDGKIQFESIDLGKEDATPGYAFKVE
jgi:hypothetical protein